MSAGLVFNTPFGSSMNWGDDWAGAHLIQSINLKAYNLQPTVSFRIGKHVSVGAGLMLTWGSFDLSRARSFRREHRPMRCSTPCCNRPSRVRPHSSPAPATAA